MMSAHQNPKNQNKAYKTHGFVASLLSLFKGKGLIILMVIAVILLGWIINTAAIRSTEDEGSGFDTPSKNPVPRWVTIRSSKVYARRGPSADNDVLWVYKQKGLPVQIISETKEWRLICDPDGQSAWVRHDMVSPIRNVMSLTPQPIALHEQAKEASKIKAHLRPKSIAKLDRCKDNWCRLSFGRDKGWVMQNSLWGAQTQAACKRRDPFADAPL